MNQTASRWMSNLKALRNDERGAEASEYVLVLVVLVVGVYFAWQLLRDVLTGEIEETADCIDEADTATAPC